MKSEPSPPVRPLPLVLPRRCAALLAVALRVGGRPQSTGEEAAGGRLGPFVRTERPGDSQGLTRISAAQAEQGLRRVAVLPNPRRAQAGERSSIAVGTTPRCPAPRGPRAAPVARAWLSGRRLEVPPHSPCSSSRGLCAERRCLGSRVREEGSLWEDEANLSRTRGKNGEKKGPSCSHGDGGQE